MSPPRIVFAKRKYLVTSLFLRGVSARLVGPLSELFKGLLVRNAERHQVDVEYFVVTSEGCGFILKPCGEEGLSGFMREIKVALAYIANQQEGRRGPVFESRFSCCELVDKAAYSDAVLRLLCWTIKQRRDWPDCVCDGLEELRAGKKIEGALAPSRILLTASCTALSVAMKAFELSWTVREAFGGPYVREIGEKIREKTKAWQIKLGEMSLLNGLSKKARADRVSSWVKKARCMVENGHEWAQESSCRGLPRALGEVTENWEIEQEEVERAWDEAMACLEDERSEATKVPEGRLEPSLLTSKARTNRRKLRATG